MITFYLPQSISNSPTKSTSYFYDYSKADFSGICNYLMDVDFSICTSTSDIDLVWITIKESILDALELYVPRVKILDLPG